MDVSATGPAVAAAAVPSGSVQTVTGSVPDSDRSQSAPVAPVASSGVPAPPVPSTQTTTAQLPGDQQQSRTLAPAIAKLFGVPAPPEPITLDVSYRVQRDPNVIVTVFTDAKTGQEVAQFPPEILIHLSQFFDQPRGVTLDQNA